MTIRTVTRPAPETWSGLIARPGGDLSEALETVRPILEDIRSRGDAALREWTHRLDGVEMAALVLDGDDMRQATDAAVRELPDSLLEAIDVAARNVEAFHRAQGAARVDMETMPGVRVWRRNVPVERVGIYIPGGSAPLFSTILMLGIPARIAGCQDIVLATPPAADGGIHPVMLHAARVAGVTRIVAAGGAQAIAALAFGTETVPKVDKIFGPGNRFVTAAKQLVAAEGVAIDMPAGPTEVAILADDTAPAAFVAADMLAQAEHGVDSHVFVVTTSSKLVEALPSEVERQLRDLPRADVAREALAHSAIVLVDTIDEAVALSEAYAPEHLIVMMRASEAVAAQIDTAGSVFVGEWTPESLGDYASGTNHTLPTGGAARAFSGVTLEAFQRTVTFQQATPRGLAALAPHVETMARAEDLEGHARAAAVRRAALSAGRETGSAGDVATAPRTGFVRRTTSETDITVHIDLDGQGRADIHTGLGFLDHMLDQIARHSGMDLTVRANGDLHIDEHHTIEDTAITLGQALSRALGDKRGITRFGFTVPMDDALARVALDLSGRSWLVWKVTFTRERVGDVPTEMFSHFFKSLTDAAAMNLNVEAGGENDHHTIESVFKGFARALGQAISSTGSEALPSTKGAL